MKVAGKDYLKGAGLQFVDGGARAAVFKNKSGEIVKAFERDPCYLNFVNIVHANQDNPHFPKLRKVAKFQRPELQGAYLVKIEPLTPLTIREFNANIGYHSYIFFELVVMGYDPHSYFDTPQYKAAFGADPRYDSSARRQAQAEANKWKQANPDFVKAINLVITKRGNKNCDYDLKNDNFMKRGETWVIIDPIVDSFNLIP